MEKVPGGELSEGEEMTCLKCGKTITAVYYLEALGYCSGCDIFWRQHAVMRSNVEKWWPKEWIASIIEGKGEAHPFYKLSYTHRGE